MIFLWSSISLLATFLVLVVIRIVPWGLCGKYIQRALPWPLVTVVFPVLELCIIYFI